MFAVTQFVLESGIIEEVVGPFPSEQDAWDWITQEIETLRPQYPTYELESSQEELLQMFSAPEVPGAEEEPHGFVYQVNAMVAPIEVVGDGA